MLAQDAAARLLQAREWLQAQGLTPGRTFALWCQGETDGDHAVSAADYRANFASVWQCLQSAGAERCGLIQIGHFNRGMFPADGRDAQYAVIRAEQLRMAAELPGVFLAGSFAPHEALMKDAFHYCQQAYDLVGREAARAAAQI